MVRKLGLIVIATFVKDPSQQIAAALGLVIFLVNVEHLQHPYADDPSGVFLHRLEIASFGVLLLLLWQSLYFNIVDCNLPSAAGYHCEALAVFAVLSEVVFIGYSVSHFTVLWCRTSTNAKRVRARFSQMVYGPTPRLNDTQSLAAIAFPEGKSDETMRWSDNPSVSTRCSAVEVEMVKA